MGIVLVVSNRQFEVKDTAQWEGVGRGGGQDSVKGRAAVG